MLLLLGIYWVSEVISDPKSSRRKEVRIRNRNSDRKLKPESRIEIQSVPPFHISCDFRFRLTVSYLNLLSDEMFGLDFGIT